MEVGVESARFGIRRWLTAKAPWWKLKVEMTRTKLRDAVGIVENRKSSRRTEDEKLRVVSMKMTRQKVEGG